MNKNDRVLAREIFNTLPLIIKVIKKSVKVTDSRLTHNQIKILHIIAHEQTTIDELAQVFSVTPPTMSETIDSLTKRNLVKKVQSKNDGRVYNIILTADAKRLVAKAHKRLIYVLNKKLDILTLDEKQILAKAMPILKKTFSINKK